MGGARQMTRPASVEKYKAFWRNGGRSLSKSSTGPLSKKRQQLSPGNT